MATYYIRKTGSDAAAGTSAGAAWLTIGKALGAAGIASGDTVYVGAGVYREVVNVAMTSATAETKVIADVDGAQTGDAGEVQWTAYLTNDTTAPSGTSLITLTNRDFLTFEKFVFVGGSAGGSVVLATGSENIKFNDCTMIGGDHGARRMLNVTATVDVALNWTFDRCILLRCGGLQEQFILPTSAIADYDVNVLFRNCLFIVAPFLINSTGAAAFKGGGVDFLNCTSIGGATFLTAFTANLSTTFPCTVNNCLIMQGTTGLNAVTLGQIVEDYNILMCGGTPRTNVTAGANSISGGSYAPLLHGGQEVMIGAALRPFLTPMAGSPILGWGGSSPPAVDLFNQTRPEGGASMSAAVGALERHNTGAKETTTVRTGPNALKLVGPSSQDFQLAVDAVSTTVTVYGRFDANHAVTNRPQMKVLNGGEAGVADATATMTAAVDTWEQLSLNFTPTAKGIVTIRLVSRSAAGNGIAFFDDFAVT